MFHRVNWQPGVRPRPRLEVFGHRLGLCHALGWLESEKSLTFHEFPKLRKGSDLPQKYFKSDKKSILTIISFIKFIKDRSIVNSTMRSHFRKTGSVYLGNELISLNNPSFLLMGLAVFRRARVMIHLKCLDGFSWKWAFQVGRKSYQIILVHLFLRKDNHTKLQSMYLGKAWVMWSRILHWLILHR